MNRIEHRFRVLFVSLGLGFGLGACGDPGSSNDCTAGTQFCTCVNGQCLAGLECVGGLCVPSDSAETGDDPTGNDEAEGDGDPGDGDPGDGDPGDGDGDNPCDPGQSLCQGKCTNTQTNPLHCGGCNDACASGEVCDGGTCMDFGDCSTGDCPGLSYCDLQTMQCLPGCINDDQCLANEECNLGTHDCECNSPPSCTMDSQCSSNSCYVLPTLGGQCGECTSDSDCANGCSPPNPYAEFELGPNCLPLAGSYCNDGSAGEGCETDAACVGGLTCETAFSVLGLLSINSCSECSSNADCGAQLCTPVVNLQTFSGEMQCLPAGSLAQNKYCDLSTNGDQTCSTGTCSAVDVMGLAQIGACGECKTDNDCGGGTCVAGQVDFDTGVLTGSTCN